ncbi:hypothetical protein [Sphaerisporangium fuscum]|uniref:hypothetical protein n=1 Tax=Sphaerisporangium fuscum TaxID=2835868 RepID=UPI001BDBC198|nr:hypothetical protein [Sphaerisporangium fuscum]
MLVVLTMRHVTGRPSDTALIDGSGMLALLPRQWSKEFHQGSRYAAIRIQTDDDTGTGLVRAQVAAILTNPEMSNWELLTCEALIDAAPRALVPAASPRHPLRLAGWN